MRTISVDDRQLIVDMMLRILNQVDEGGMRVDPSKLDCDYYRYLEGDPQAIRSFVGQYMQQYDFAEETALQLSARL